MKQLLFTLWAIPFLLFAENCNVQQVFIDRIIYNNKVYSSGNDNGYHNKSYLKLDTVFAGDIFGRETVPLTIVPGFIGEVQPVNYAVYVLQEVDGEINEWLKYEAKNIIGKAQANIKFDHYGLNKFRVIATLGEINSESTCSGEIEDYSILAKGHSVFVDEPIFDATKVHINAITINGCKDIDSEDYPYGSFPNNPWCGSGDERHMIYLGETNTFKFEAANIGGGDLYWHFYLDYNRDRRLSDDELVAKGLGNDFEGEFYAPLNQTVYYYDGVYEDEVGLQGYIIARKGEDIPDVLDQWPAVYLGDAEILPFPVHFFYKGGLEQYPSDKVLPYAYSMQTLDIKPTSATLEWHSIYSEFAEYYCQPFNYKINIISEDGTYDKTFESMPGGQSDKVTIIGLEPNTKYFWRVHLDPDACNSDYPIYVQKSSYMQFTTLEQQFCYETNEPNDTKALATPMIINDPKYGKICIAGDDDFFSFEINSNIPQSYDIHLTGMNKPETGGIYYMLLYKEGQFWFINGSAIDTTEPKTLTQALTAGKYYIQVHGKEVIKKSEYYKVIVEPSAPIIWYSQNDQLMYPNPAKRGQDVFIHAAPENTSYAIYDQMGFKVTEGSLSDKTISLSGIARPGLYYISINAEKFPLIVE